MSNADMIARAMAAAAMKGGGGSGGVTDYDKLKNRPKINGVTLSGNKTADDLNIHAIPAGGKTGQVLQKTADEDYRAEWADTGAAITAEGVLVGDGAGNVTGRPFDQEPTKDSENLLTSGTVYAAYSNVLLVAGDKLEDKSGADRTDAAKNALGIVPAAVLTGTLPAGETELALTDAHITDGVTVQLYTDTYGVSPQSVTVTEGVIAMTFTAQAADVNIRAEVGSVSWVEPVQPVEQGDMRKAVYDPIGRVAAAGGIPGFVGGKQDKEDDTLQTTSKAIVGAINELKAAVDALGKVSSVKVAETKPEQPAENTLYYVGTASPYHIWLYAGQWYDMGTTELNLSDYVTQAVFTAALAQKQDKLTEEQLAAANSGVTAERAVGWDGKADGDLANVQNTVFKQKAVDSGIQFPAFEWSKPTLDMGAKIKSTSADLMKISEKLYYLKMEIQINKNMSSGVQTTLFTFSNLPSSRKSGLAALTVCPSSAANGRLSCYYFPSAGTAFGLAGGAITSGSSYIISGILAV